MPVFGLSEEQVSAFGMSFGLGAFMLFMLFIIGELAWKARARKVPKAVGRLASATLVTARWPNFRR